MGPIDRRTLLNMLPGAEVSVLADGAEPQAPSAPAVGTSDRKPNVLAKVVLSADGA